MEKKDKILCIIPARGGSKGIPGKNIYLLAGKPLVAYTIEQARNTPAISRVMVSTDSEKIANVARQYKAEVPFIRPVELAQDDTPDYPVYNHAVKWLIEHENFDPEIVVWLRPTTPLRHVEDIQGAIQQLIQNPVDCVRSISPVEHHPYWMKKLKQDYVIEPFIDGHDEQIYYRRQLLPPAYRLNGAVDVVYSQAVSARGSLFGGKMGGYVMPIERSIDIDTELDLAICEILLKKRREHANSET